MLDLGLPTPRELLDPITPQYIADLICWSAIGARTAESQTHRQMASGLSMPLGFKNGTDGSISNGDQRDQGGGPAADVSRHQPRRAGVRHRDTRQSLIATSCSAAAPPAPTIRAADIARTEQLLVARPDCPSVLVDCSHDNSAKQPERQPEVMRDLLAQIAAGNRSIIGAMIESNLQAGSQAFPQPKDNLHYGVSITDACIDWPTTETLVRDLHAALAPRFQ